MQSIADRHVHAITGYSFASCRGETQRGPTSLVVHLDIDAFYAQVEQQDYELRGIPLIVGGWTGEAGQPRGIVATASYEARRFGIRTGMSHMEALQRCPLVVAFRIDYEKYRCVSKRISCFLERFAPKVERFSMDEFFMEIAAGKSMTIQDQNELLKNLQHQLWRQFSLTASLGLAHSKTHAKLASGIRKPSGLVNAADPEMFRRKLKGIPLDQVMGIGPSRSQKLGSIGIQTIADAIRSGPRPFELCFGSHLGRVLWQNASGQERAPVFTETPEPQQFHHLHSFAQPTKEIERIREELRLSIALVCRRLRLSELACAKWEVYIRFKEVTWEGVPVLIKLADATHCDDRVLVQSWRIVGPILKRFIGYQRWISGIGICALTLTSAHERQTECLPLKPIARDQLKAFYAAIDTANHDYGGDVVGPAADLLLPKDVEHHFLPPA